MIAAPARAGARHVSPYLLLVLPPLFWAVNWIIGRGMHTSIPPMAMAFYRWLFAILVLLPFALPHLRREWRLVLAHRRILLLLGLVGVGSHNALAYLGLNYTSATNGVILNSFIPVLIIALSWIFLRNRLTLLQLGGVVVSLCGVLAILSGGSIGELAAFRLNIGDLYVMLSMLLWAIYTICLRWRPPDLHALTFLFAISCVGDASMLPFYLAEMAFGYHTVWTWQAILALASMGVFSSVLAYVCWTRGVEEVGSSVAGLFLHLMPVFGTLLAWLFLGEKIAAFHIAGIALILAGIYVTSRGARNPAPAVPDG